MRVTGSMMSNNAMMHMAKSKAAYNKYLEQYASETKILRASDDPIIAVRSLKYRTRISEVEQYLDKNIPDAASWMSSTDEILTNVSDLLSRMNEKCEEAQNGDKTPEDRDKIVAELLQRVGEIFESNANQKSADRYLFTGYRTDVPLLFDKDTDHLQYNITENLVPSDILPFTYVYGGKEYDPAITDISEYTSDLPQSNKTHVMTLSYDNLDDGFTPTIQYTNKDGTTGNLAVITKSLTPGIGERYNECYNPGPDEVYFIPETGEMVFGQNTYAEVSEATNIAVNYEKTEFEKNEIRPEHYFNCTTTNLDTGTAIPYREPESQKINYQINFSQTMTVNTLACDAFDTSIRRAVDRIVAVQDEINVTKAAMTKIEKDIEAGIGDPAILNQVKTQLEDKLKMQEKMYIDSFGDASMIFQGAQSTVGVEMASMGARVNRLESTELMLKEQSVNFEEALSENEDVDLGEAYIRFNEAELLYNATLRHYRQQLKSSEIHYWILSDNSV